MLYVILAFGSLAGVTMPTLQGVISRQAGADEQGGIQGAIGSLASITGILGPAIVTFLFSYFISDKAPAHVPGMPYFFSATLMLVAMFTTVHALRKVTPLPVKTEAPSAG